MMRLNLFPRTLCNLLKSIKLKGMNHFSLRMERSRLLEPLAGSVLQLRIGKHLPEKKGTNVPLFCRTVFCSRCPIDANEGRDIHVLMTKIF